ncbi:radical SAM/SPASM domain-containing protein [Brachyspira murdochii]|uniref:Radical SAM domain protein n=1 Tax=Brachyspira murdochii (strain ATCC 51284 / DSM 12563 / 56-150) TaxID=526224 RepID=D5U3Y9_BRAM5|nr:radical SAM/SPASM domain-containing protein [Brachyspira murdochii]ADG70156.1 Radical SAM domain protein [Brachyspira murdochii DSM 12563]
MNNVSVLIKPSSSLCNIKCKYCFYIDEAKNRKIENNGIMTEKVMTAIIDKVLQNADKNVLFSFQGGEPTTAGIEYFNSFIDYVNNRNKKNINVKYSIQTNGILIDDKWGELFKKNNFLVGLSFDMIKDIHDKYRTDKIGNATYNKVLETKKLFDAFNIEYNILTVLTSKLSKYPKDVYKKIKKLNLKYTQFIPCLSDINSNDNNTYSITPKEFSNFYKEIFSLWKEDFFNNIYYSIQFFDNIIPLFGGGYAPMTCGINGICTNQMIIESNGDVFPCDFYCLDNYKLGNIADEDFDNIFYNQKAKDFINEKTDIINNDDYKLCRSCRYFKICKLGCKRMLENMYIDNKDKTFCGYKDFLDYSINDIIKIWKIVSR